MRIVVATKNQGKIREIEKILNNKCIKLISMEDAGVDIDVIEDGETFKANAVKKARTIAKATGLPAISDDSGICVDALNGAPGVHSARYSGECVTDMQNNKKLIEQLKKLGNENSPASFKTVVALAQPNGSFVTFSGETFGHILLEPIGNGGFGYDPLFFSDDLQKSFGEATLDEKNNVSHRARALAKLDAHLRK